MEKVKRLKRLQKRFMGMFPWMRDFSSKVREVAMVLIESMKIEGRFDLDNIR